MPAFMSFGQNIWKADMNEKFNINSALYLCPILIYVVNIFLIIIRPTLFWGRVHKVTH